MLPVIEVTEHKLDYLRGHHDLRGCLEAAMAGATKMAVTYMHMDVRSLRSMAGERQLKIQRSPVSKVRGTGRGESGRTVCRQHFLGTSFEFADLAAH